MQDLALRDDVGRHRMGPDRRHLRRPASVAPNAVVEFNRAVAVLEHRGPAAALDALDEIDVPTYHLFHATRAEALRAGRDDEAADALRRAIALTRNAAEGHHLERKWAGLVNAAPAAEVIS
jgi:predicted RNA polymerase sigma factor